MIVLSTQALPLVLALRPKPRAIVYDPANLGFVDAVGRGEGYSIYELPTLAEMQAEVGSISTGTIGLAIPLDHSLEEDDTVPIELTAYHAHAMKDEDFRELTDFFEEVLSGALGKTVKLVDGGKVYPTLTSGGHPFMVGITLVVAILTVGSALVPVLMLEEKEKHTMAALLVSPAGYGQIVIGKALAGMFYCLSAVGVVFALNIRLIASWPLAILAALAGALFTVGLGLLFGVLFEQQQTMSMVMGISLLALLVPIILGLQPSAQFPPVVQAALPYLPSIAMAKIFLMSFSKLVDSSVLFFNLALLLGWAVLLLLLVVWRVRALDR
jgi:ABC-2 type transport system permease protein